MNQRQTIIRKKRVPNHSMRFFSTIACLVIFSGCAHNDWTIDLPLTEDATGYTGGNNRLLKIPNVIDERVDKERSGTKAGAGNIYPNRDLPEWLTLRIREELRSAGFKVIDENKENPSSTIVETHLRVFFTEQVVQWSTLDFETDISLRIRVIRPDGLEAKRDYYVKGLNQGQILAAGHYVLSQKKATNRLMKRVVADLINLLNHYPEQQSSSQERLVR